MFLILGHEGPLSLSTARKVLGPLGPLEAKGPWLGPLGPYPLGLFQNKKKSSILVVFIKSQIIDHR